MTSSKKHMFRIEYSDYDWYSAESKEEALEDFKRDHPEAEVSNVE